MIWTLMAVFISNDDNQYSMNTFTDNDDNDTRLIIYTRTSRCLLLPPPENKKLTLSIVVPNIANIFVTIHK